jgi:molybdenum cofactor synthesis domain-containing protein
MGKTGVAAVITGTEVLTAKIVDQNGPLLIRRLRERGVPLHWMCTVHDDADAIVEAVGIARRRAAITITSGGIGPTHDDVTARAVARALGRDVMRHPELEALIRTHYMEEVSTEALRIADVPEGTELISQEGTWFPIMRCEDVFLLPGVPQLFRLQLETVLRGLTGARIHLWALYLSVGEGAIAAVLDEVSARFADVAMGSYPEFGPAAGYRVKLTLEGPDAARVELAAAALREGLPQGSVLREEPAGQIGA